MPAPLPAPTWRTVSVGSGAGSERYRVMEAGDPSADPLVFLHGWGLTPRAYADGVLRLCSAGVRVIAPALPGTSGSTGPGLRHLDLGEYAARVARALEAAGLDRPAFVAGHSFGGGVALRLATDRPDLVRSLTLLNSVGGAPGPRPARGADATSTGGGLTRRSWVRWALGAATELHPRDVLGVAPAVLRDAGPALARRPVTAALAALLALRCSLADEASALVATGLPVLFVWSDSDRLITPGSLAAVTSALPAQVVRGRHGWLLTRPEEFAALLRNALVVHAMLERRQRGQALVLPEGFSLADLIPQERRRAARFGDGAQARRRGTAVASPP